MKAQHNLSQLLKTLQPKLQEGLFAFCTLKDLDGIVLSEALMLFREEEGITAILPKEIADRLQISYTYLASWISLTVHSSLAGIGLTAAFSKALAEKGIGCNVVAAYYHDHIFVDAKDSARAMDVLQKLSANYSNF